MNNTFFSISKSTSTILFLLTAFLIIIMMIYGESTLVPIVFAIGIWGLLNTITSRIQQLKIGRFQIPSWLALILVLVIVIFLLLRLVGVLLENINGFMDSLPQYTENLNNLLQTLPDSLWVGLFGKNADLSVGIVEQLFTLVTDYFSDYMSVLASSVASLAGNAIYIIIYVIFLVLEQGTFATKAHNMFRNDQTRAEFQSIIASIHEQIQTYVTVKTLVSLMTGVVSYAIMWLFGLDYAIIWAILIFILNFIPNIGSIVAVIFPVIMGLLQFDSLGTVGTMAVLLTLVQLVVGNFIEPRMMGNQLNISSFVVLVALGVFGAIWGIAGMFFSVPITVILMIIFSHFDSSRFIAVLLSGDGIVHGIEE
ncbi:MAG: AI-2E family transporter [Chloroflexota bacterium]